MGHYQRVVAEINLDAIEHNLASIRHHIPSSTKVCSVIKADGYGHGAIPLAKTLVDLGVDTFAVATCDEAMRLRKNGIDQMLLVLGYTTEADLVDIVHHSITQTIFRMDMAEKLSKVAVQVGKVAHVHILLDTGMGRLGFMPTEETVQLVKDIKQLPFISMDGVYSHFARADELDKSVCEKQYSKYQWFVERLKEEGLSDICLHLSNSATVIDLPKANYDMVRVGIATYGLYPSEEVMKDVVELRPVLSLKSHVILVKDVPVGQPISYGGTFVTKRTSKIATIPVGYGDGYPRALSSKGDVLIRGKRAPIIGRVCMDLLMVDVTDIEGVQNEDDVVLIGRSGKEQITVEEIAGHMGTINYEVVCQLGKRIPRVYIKQGEPVRSIDYFQ